MVEMGEQYEGCGEKSGRITACSTSGYVHENPETGHYFKAHKNDCKRELCPVCGDLAIWRDAQKSAKKVRDLEVQLIKRGVRTDRVEVIFQVPRDKQQDAFSTLEGYEKAQEDFNACMVDFGVLGTIAVCHPWSVNRHQGVGYKEFEKFKAGDPTAKIRWNPHFQAVGLRRKDWHNKAAMKAMKKWQDKGYFVGIIYADGRPTGFKPHGSRPWGTSTRHLAKKIKYELGHAVAGTASNGKKKNIVRWTGLLSYNSHSCKVNIEKEPLKCKCGKLCYYWPDEVSYEEAYKRVEHRKYSLSEKAFKNAVARNRLTVGALPILHFELESNEAT